MVKSAAKGAVKSHVPSTVNGFVSESTRKRLQHLVSAHVDSYNYFLEQGIVESINDIPPLDMKLDDNLYVKFTVTNANIAAPTKKDDLTDGILMPRECRERGLSYAGAMTCNITITVGNDDAFNDIRLTTRLGDMPVMVRSERCHLRGYSGAKLVAAGEEANEMGGYFICNGIERVIRLLQVPRRNFALAIERSSFKNRGPLYSDKGIMMRCVRPDQSSATLTMHYLNNGSATLRFVIRKQEFLLPVTVVMKALEDISDKEIYDRVLQGDHQNTFSSTRLELLLRDAKQYGVFTRRECLSYLGAHFRIFLPLTDRASDEEAGRMLLDRYVCVHTASHGAKLECLLHMLRKLFMFVQNRCEADNADALMTQELLLPGHLISMYVKEKIEEAVLNVKGNLLRDYRVNKAKCLTDIQSVKYFQKVFDRFASSIGSRIGTFLSTGNIVSSTGLDLMQVSGYTIVAERLNIFRYMSHFQSVHRGQFFTTMKTTAVRKLLPESWGFLCPVHTPDGSPCGLLNHLARDAVILAYPPTQRLPTTPTGELVPPSPKASQEKGWAVGKELNELLVSLGVVPAGAGSGSRLMLTKRHLPVLVDGIVIGGVVDSEATELVKKLRLLKVMPPENRLHRIDPTAEIAYIPPALNGLGAYPGLFIFTQAGRMIRPVYHYDTQLVEYIGPIEQVYLDIACLKEDIRAETTHVELSPTVMLSQVASLTPFSDYNQSPRNMYQCQMGKQTMGTPAHALKHRADNKLYRIQTPQVPLVQTAAHREYMMDEYPQGTNAVVAVISYTGYDMEDAMIINKSSYERGFGHGSVYKSYVIDLDEEEKKAARNGGKPTLRFGNIKPATASLSSTPQVKYCESLDVDGLPMEGEIVEYGDALCCLVDDMTNECRLIKHKEHERAYVETIRVFGNTSSVTSTKKPSPVRKIAITLRLRRNPIIGDKFSSRHGQKGTLSVLWPQENMPFSESGMSPDVIINPHAFPSRMTIGMLIESMAGKSGAMHGLFQDATPFKFHEENKVIDYFGEQLAAAGYQYYGSEPMYSGISGKVMEADIFVGLVYYQRLRHMVSDKSQARATGPVMAITRQPVKGRKKGGGIRLGEMERDSLLSHGVSFIVRDRLLNCSDIHVAHVCGECGGMINVHAMTRRNDVVATAVGVPRYGYRKQVCRHCNTDKHVKPVHLPYVYRYLINELAGMGIRLTMKLSD